MLYFDVDIALVALIFLLTGMFIRKNNFVERMDLKIFIVLTVILLGAFLFNEILARSTDISPDNFLINPAIIFTATFLGVLIPPFIAKKFGKLPVLKYFCS